MNVVRTLIRLPLRVIPKSAILRILSSPNRGLRWVVGTGQHGCWLGHYEKNTANRIASLVRPGTIALDVGAHAGYYTLLMSKRVGPGGRVFAFEANPINAANLKRYLILNNISNVEVLRGRL